MTTQPDPIRLGGNDPGPIQEISLRDPNTKSLGEYSLNPDEATLAPNGGRCLECTDLVPQGQPCKYDAEHTIEPLHLSPTGLGYDNDDDFFNWGSDQFEYPASGD